MSFEVYVPMTRSKVAVGCAALQGNGQLQLHPGDLVKIGIKKECVILVDTATQRIGIRPPNPDEGGLREPTIIVGLNKSATRARFRIAGALKAIGLSVDEAKGRIRTIVSPENRLITLSFGGVDGISKKGRGK